MEQHERYLDRNKYSSEINGFGQDYYGIQQNIPMFIKDGHARGQELKKANVSAEVCKME